MNHDRRIRILAIAAAISSVVVGAGLIVSLFTRQNARAASEYSFGPAWSDVTSGSGDFSFIWSGPYNITGPAAAMFHLTFCAGCPGNSGVQNYPITISDTGTVTVPVVTYPGQDIATAVIQDGADGIFMSYQQVDNTDFIMHVSRNGTRVWNTSFALDSGYDKKLLVRDWQGNVIEYSQYQGAAGTVKLRKLNQSTGAIMYAAPGYTDPHVPGDELPGPPIPYSPEKMVSNPSGGAVLVYGGSGWSRVIGVDNNGTMTWNDAPISNKKHVDGAIAFNGKVYVQYAVSTDNTVRLRALNLSNGTSAWAQDVTVGTEDAGAGAARIVRDGDDLVVAWKPTATTISVQRYEALTGTARWAAPVVALTTASGDDWNLSEGNASVSFVADCDITTRVCKFQGVDRTGAIILAAGGMTAHNSNVPYFGFHERTAGASTSNCVAQAWREFLASTPDPYGFQLYCSSAVIAGTFTVSAPECSLDGGLTYGSCDRAQPGTLVTHVRSTCAGAPVSEVRFSATKPSGPLFSNQLASSVGSNTYVLKYPFPVSETGDWSISATCTDTIGDRTTASTTWSVSGSPAPSSPQKLTLYDGTAHFSDGETMEIGSLGSLVSPIPDANADLMSSGELFFRPNLSDATSFFQGVWGQAKQRLQLVSSQDGQPALEAVGIGKTNDSWIGPGIRGVFQGAGFISGGSAIYGEVTSCGAGKTCYAGYFSNAVSGLAVSVKNSSMFAPALDARNTGGGQAARFTGTVIVTGDVSADANVPDGCTWHPISEPGACPTGQVINGFRFSPANIVSQYQCCTL